MSDDIFRQSRSKINPSEVRGRPIEMDEDDMGEILPDALQKVREVQGAMAQEVGQQAKMPPQMMPTSGPDAPFQIGGNMPPEFRAALQQKTGANTPQKTNIPQDFDDEGQRPQPPRKKKKPTPDRSVANQ